MYAVATRSTPTPTSRSPAPCTPRWRWPGSPASASSTTCTTPRRRAVRRPQRDGRGAASGGRRRRVRLTLLDACYLPAAWPRRPPAAGSRAATVLRRRRGAWAERVGACTGRRRRAGRRGHPLRAAVPADQLETVARGPRSAGPPCAPVRAARRERGLPGSPRPHPDAAARRLHGVLGPRTTGVHATHLTAEDVSAPRRQRHRHLHVPHHRTRPRRRHRPGRSRCGTRAPRSSSAPTSTPSSTCSKRPARSRWTSD